VTNQEFTEDLDEWLNAVRDRYEVQYTLKDTPSEVTEIVWRRAQGTLDAVGPFVRKTFRNTDGRGSAYAAIWRAQVQGKKLENLPRVYECELTDDDLQVVMEHVKGETLARLAEHAAPGVGLAATVMPGLCIAATELHESLGQPVIHRDIKPSNIIVSADRVTLIDLGIARQWHENATRDTERLGTPGYAPPEQYGFGQTSVRSDVYALGMTCAFCLIGETPSQELLESGFVDRRIPEKLARILRRACAFDPAARYESAEKLRRDLCSVLPVADSLKDSTAEPFHVTGIIWNTFLVIAWVFIFAAVVGASYSEKQAYSNQPRALVILQFVFFASIPSSFIVYLISDKRRLKRRFPALDRITLSQEIIGCIIASIVSIMLAFAIAYVASQSVG
jgi:serine/threonine protein kinase